MGLGSWLERKRRHRVEDSRSAEAEANKRVAEDLVRQAHNLDELTKELRRIYGTSGGMGSG